jgi:site-specific DNA-methyltransferase (adenine-specific)
MFSSRSNEWETPPEFFEKLNKKFKFTLDPCCTPTSAKCEKYYTREDDGLSKSWKNEVVFVNPPYGDISKWVKKAHDESRDNDATVVMLLPSRTDTKYWHDHIMEASAIYFIKGRLKFGNGNDKQNSAPFPSVVVVFDLGRFRWVSGPTTRTMER